MAESGIFFFQAYAYWFRSLPQVALELKYATYITSTLLIPSYWSHTWLTLVAGRRLVFSLDERHDLGETMRDSKNQSGGGGQLPWMVELYIILAELTGSCSLEYTAQLGG